MLQAELKSQQKREGKQAQQRTGSNKGELATLLPPVSVLHRTTRATLRNICSLCEALHWFLIPQRVRTRGASGHLGNLLLLLLSRNTFCSIFPKTTLQNIFLKRTKTWYESLHLKTLRLSLNNPWVRGGEHCNCRVRKTIFQTILQNPWVTTKMVPWEKPQP